MACNLHLRFSFPPGSMWGADGVSIYEAEGDPYSYGTLLGVGLCGIGVYGFRLSVLRLTKAEMKEMLFGALEKHDAKRKIG